jgi:glycosyltransferase involved in cell wall biosynthesis
MEYIRDSSVTIIDWADHMAIEMTRGIKTGKIIVRLHSYEFFDSMVDHINYSNVDKFIVVNYSLSNLMHKRVSISNKKLKTVYHGIDLKKFQIANNKVKSNKVGVAGYINYKKDPSFMLNCFHEISKLCPQLEFVWAGEHQDLRYHLNMIHNMSKYKFKLTMLPWQTDMNKFYEDIDYTISSSLFESCHLSILEGMACGVIPQVRLWEGADNIYPSHSLFITPDSCAQKIFLFENNQILSGSLEEKRQAHRDWVKKYFSWEKHVESMDAVIQEVLGE